MRFSERLSYLRKNKKIGQAELAKTIGTHTNVLGRYERGEAKPSIEMAVKLADALDTSLDYLTGRTDIEIDKILLNKLVNIQKLPRQDHDHIMYSIDGLIQHAKTRQAYS